MHSTLNSPSLQSKSAQAVLRLSHQKLTARSLRFLLSTSLLTAVSGSCRVLLPIPINLPKARAATASLLVAQRQGGILLSQNQHRPDNRQQSPKEFQRRHARPAAPTATSRCHLPTTPAQIILPFFAFPSLRIPATSGRASYFLGIVVLCPEFRWAVYRAQNYECRDAPQGFRLCERNPEANEAEHPSQEFFSRGNGGVCLLPLC